MIEPSDGTEPGGEASCGGSVETTTWIVPFMLLVRFSVTSAESESWLTVARKIVPSIGM